MKKILYILSVSLLSFSLKAQVFPNLGGQRAGISALSYLKLENTPRAAGLAGASAALTYDAYSPFWNPGATGRAESFGSSVSDKRLPAGINYSSLAILTPLKSEKGVISASFSVYNAGEMLKRTEFFPQGNGETFYARSTMIGLTYGRLLSERFSFGLTLKYITEQLAEFRASTVMADLGMQYLTDWKEFRFAVTILNFGPNSSARGSFSPGQFYNGNRVVDGYQAPTEFKMGFSLVPFKRGRHKLLTLAQLNHPNDNAENIRIAAEYSYLRILYGRIGYMINVTGFRTPTFGLGVKSRIGKYPMAIDMAFEPSQFLGNWLSFGLNFNFPKPKMKKNESN